MDDNVTNISRENYLLLGEIKAMVLAQSRILEEFKPELREVKSELKELKKEVDERIGWLEKKVHYALGAVAASVFVFQAAWKYLTGK